ncbi:hypothetical protein [Couchioplanes azureus]|uniref:hypothetical protein n=1 Tax=Couchioplanes caeruleus TaxID=56438 RepID=UPI00198B8CB4|nr:hypothetical protein [Couchioplanes caeruleus]GGQ54210.1 hypothetical protein GCM10010166_23910 [Couchioplanes caeruleus subsp. azureus]
MEKNLRRLTAPAALALLVVALAACAPVTTLAARQVPADDGPQPHVQAGALHGRTAAFLTVRDAASRVEVRLAELPGLLYRVTTPADSGLAPQVTGVAGRVRLALVPTGGDGPDTVEVLLNRQVRWDLRLPAGAGEHHLDLAAGRVRRLELSGAGLVSMRLPHPAGAVPISLTGTVGELAVAVPAGTAVKLRLRAGAGLVAVPWADRAPAAPGAAVAPPGWAAARNRYQVDAAAEVGSVTVWG